ncbi:hypothetical protein KFK09_029178 [Dendrobium nobile]|uniref:Uncharacterized protein n=1 Tax=Dendrobium nobile TaxID=94219 RepID=A0A8T3A4S6_DENNO|nr:hypothetical protein KFK09_029178 [Dendrobium nobile]
MGCGISRLESGEEIPSGLLPFMRRIHDLKRTKTDVSQRVRRERKDSIVSTTELLRPEERDIDYYDAAVMETSGEKDEVNGKGNEMSDSSGKVKEKGIETSDSSEKVNEKVEKVDEDEEEGRRIGFGREAAAEDEFPGSPSFRFYFTDAAQDHKPDALKSIEEKELLEEKQGLVAAEGSDLKAIKKEKGRKFMTLPKANFLNVRGCYNMNSSNLAAQQGTRILSEKATQGS